MTTPTRADLDDMADRYQDDELLAADGLEHACLGVIEAFGVPPRLLYDVEAILAGYVSQDGMTRDEAEEFFHFNVAGAGVGDTGPAFLYRLDTA